MLNVHRAPPYNPPTPSGPSTMSEVNAAAMVLMSLRRKPSTDSLSTEDSVSPRKRHHVAQYDDEYSGNEYDDDYYSPSHRLPPMKTSPPTSPQDVSMMPHMPDMGHPGQLDYGMYIPGRDILRLAGTTTSSLMKKNFNCQNCGRSFARREHLFRHVETMHHGQKDFKCDMCARVFSRKDNMMQHIRNKHGKGKDTPSD